MSELSRNLNFPPVDYALTCSPEQLRAEGFGRTDIVRLFTWLDGSLGFITDHELRRFRRLQTLVIRNAP